MVPLKVPTNLPIGWPRPLTNLANNSSLVGSAANSSNLSASYISPSKTKPRTLSAFLYSFRRSLITRAGEIGSSPEYFWIRSGDALYPFDPFSALPVKWDDAIDEVDFIQWWHSQNSIFDQEGYLKEIYFNNSNYRKISENLISDIVKARLDEILEILKKQIILTELNLNSVMSVLVVGGGSNLLNLEKYFSNFLGLNVKKLEEKDKKNNPKNFDSCLGALKIIKDGWETEAIPEIINKNIDKIGFFAKIFGNTR